MHSRSISKTGCFSFLFVSFVCVCVCVRNVSYLQIRGTKWGKELCHCNNFCNIYWQKCNYYYLNRYVCKIQKPIHEIKIKYVSHIYFLVWKYKTLVLLLDLFLSSSSGYTIPSNKNVCLMKVITF